MCYLKQHPNCHTQSLFETLYGVIDVKYLLVRHLSDCRNRVFSNKLSAKNIFLPFISISFIFVIFVSYRLLTRNTYLFLYLLFKTTFND